MCGREGGFRPIKGILGAAGHPGGWEGGASAFGISNNPTKCYKCDPVLKVGYP